MEEKRILITGASRGLGFEMALRLSELGYRVIGTATSEKGVAKIADSLPSSIALQMKIDEDESVASAYSQIQESGELPCILINNAGNNIPEHFTKVKRKNMEYLVKINTISSFNIAQLCALKMIKLKNRKKIGGSIVNMSSQMGHVGGPVRSVYNMNKFGLEGLTKGMAIDLAKYNIRVNTVCPTFAVTPMTKKFLKSKKFKRETLNNIPLGRFAEMPEIASAAVFLASDAASMVTGTSLLVDGGWTAK